MKYSYMTGMSGLGALGTSTSNPTESEVETLQRAILAAGCDVGAPGVDGIFGPLTRAGLNCMIENLGGDAVRSQFPFVDFLLGYGGTYRPAPAGGNQPPPVDPRQAGVGGDFPWWGWALVAVGGVVMLGAVALMLSGDESSGRDRRAMSRYEPRYDDWDF